LKLSDTVNRRKRRKEGAVEMDYPDEMRMLVCDYGRERL
jgi:hypothetical protein